jgi:squalene-associated FAD-dependent desaturase
VDRNAHALAGALSGAGKRLAVVGAGWAGLAAAVRAVEAGHRVTVFEMAPHPGGRAREVMHDGIPLDNGQHILIGAYRETLALMRTVGADPDALLDRRPLALLDPRGQGLALPRGAAVPAFVRAVLALHEWPLRERLALLAVALRWRLDGFRAPPRQTVAELTHRLPVRARQTLIDPLCVAALNTPSTQASAQVFLRVLRDALFSGPGAADLLLPRVSLGELLPAPAVRWLQAHGAGWHAARRVQSLQPQPAGAWQVDAARLAQPVAPAWAATAAAFEYEPIVTVYLRSRGTRLGSPMVALASDRETPAQFAFDLGALDRSGRREGLFAFVVSGARAWVERGLDSTAQAALLQAASAFDATTWREPPTLVRCVVERRATFLCTPILARPASFIAPGLAAAGDYTQGPYPATLEGAVRSALEALRVLGLRAA